jgi:predicted lipoprotein with Yx(FWY)xxD motif
MAIRGLMFATVASTLAVMTVGCGGGTNTTNPTAAEPPYAREGTKAAATTSAPVAGHGVIVTTKSVRLGTVLAAGSGRRTVYLFEADRGSTSACYAACARVWLPVITKGAPRVAGMAIPADLGTITRTDGRKQVTYFHHPLYYYSGDRGSRDVNGRGIKSFGSTWYPLRTIGVKFDKPWV